MSESRPKPKRGRPPRQPGQPVKGRPKSIGPGVVTLAVSLAAEDRARLEAWAAKHDLPSLSAAMRRLIQDGTK